VVDNNLRRTFATFVKIQPVGTPFPGGDSRFSTIVVVVLIGMKKDHQAGFTEDIKREQVTRKLQMSQIRQVLVI
jgi:hypothetical protein